MIWCFHISYDESNDRNMRDMWHLEQPIDVITDRCVCKHGNFDFEYFCSSVEWLTKLLLKFSFILFFWAKHLLLMNFHWHVKYVFIHNTQGVRFPYYFSMSGIFVYMHILAIVQENIFTYDNVEKCFNNLIETIKLNRVKAIRYFTIDLHYALLISVHLYICIKYPILIAIWNM